MPPIEDRATTSTILIEEGKAEVAQALHSNQQIGFMSVGSGSSGNCYYFSSHEGAILIDVGVPLNQLEQALQSIGKNLYQITAILVTHSHSDHSRNVARLSHLYNIPVFAPQEVFSLLDNLKSKFRIPYHKRVIIKEDIFFSLAGFQIETFSVPHDCPENLGYVLSRKKFRLALFTDVGHYTPKHYVVARSCNHLILESNFDRDMLQKGSYPYRLKMRVASDFGHTGNYEASLFLSQVYHPKMKQVWLCHLSKENNTPECCMNTFRETFFHRGLSIEGLVSTLPRYKHTPLYLYPEEG